MLKLVAHPKKGLSPIISTILLVVIAVILVTLILTWGKESANTNLSRTDDILNHNILSDKRPFLSFVEAKNGMFIFDYYPPASQHDINFTVSYYSVIGYNDYIPLEPEYTFSRRGRHLVPLGLVNPDKYTLSLLLSDGKYLNFEKVKSINNSPRTSDCPEGYIPVPGNHLYGTYNSKGGFCVAKYEMKMDADGNGIGDLVSDYSTCKYTTDYNVWYYANTGCKPADFASVNGTIVSSAEGSPITGITQTVAKTECTNIGGHLITNEEWMTLARNIEMVQENWSGGEIGAGKLSRGNTNLGMAAEGTHPAGTGSGDTKRTFTLTNGEVIWDLAGNVYEWVDKTISRKDQPDGVFDVNGLPYNSNFAWFNYSKGGGDYNHYISYKNLGETTLNYKDLFLLYPEYNAGNNGVGRIYTYSNWVDTGSTTYAFLRGGGWNGSTVAGLLALGLGYRPSSASFSRGFRCVVVPK